MPVQLLFYGGNMAKKKKIPCRVCGKLFEPCSYCQSHADVFRWRNFACSRECATKYITDTIAYREFLKNKEEETDSNEETMIKQASNKKFTTTRKKTNKKITTETIANELENKETE